MKDLSPQQNLWQRYGAFLVNAVHLVKMSESDRDRLKIYEATEAVVPQENELFIRLDTASMEQMGNNGKIYTILRGLAGLHQDEATQDLEVPCSEEEVMLAQNKMIYRAMHRGGYLMNHTLNDLTSSSDPADVLQYVRFLATNPVVQPQDARLARKMLPQISWTVKETLAEELGGKQLGNKWLFFKVCQGLNQALAADILFLDMPEQTIEKMEKQAAEESPNEPQGQNFFTSHYRGTDVVFLSYVHMADQFYSDDQMALDLARHVVAHKSELPEREQVKMILSVFKGSPLSALKGLNDMGDQVSSQDLKLFLETVLMEDDLYTKSERRYLSELTKRFSVRKAKQADVPGPKSQEKN